MNNQINNFNNEIKFIQECPVCHTPRRVIKANVLEEGETNRLIYLTCPACQSSIIMLISLGTFGIDSIGLLTDLLPLEVLKFKETNILGADDLLDLHQILNNNSLLSAINN